MNILLEIADRDIIFIALAFIALVIFALVIFYILGKDNKIKPISEEVLEEEQEEPKIELTEEQIKAKEELERVFNQMSADLEAKNPKPEEIEDFERMQEETAIISYQELIRQVEAKQKNTTTPEKNQKEEIKEPIQMQLEITEKEIKTEEPKKFKNSEIISPIFGVQNPNTISNAKTEYKKKVEYKEEPLAAKHAYENLKKNYEDENNMDFLNSLKEFRKNL